MHQEENTHEDSYHFDYAHIHIYEVKKPFESLIRFKQAKQLE